MIERILLWIGAIVLVCGVCSRAAVAQGGADQRSLKGIGALRVLVEDLPTETQDMELTKEQIQSDIEAQLKSAGMRVVTMEESTSVPGSPFLDVRVFLTHDGRAVAIEVEVREIAKLMRNGELASVGTWIGGGIGQHADAATIRDDIKQVVSQFLGVWRGDNPEK